MIDDGVVYTESQIEEILLMMDAMSGGGTASMLQKQGLLTSASFQQS